MTTQSSTVDKEEVERFSRIANEWWDENGKFKPLHRMNPLRLGYIRQQTVAHFGLDPKSMKPLNERTVLDIGCGGGLLCEPLTRLGAKVTGIDASDKNIKVAALHAARSSLEIDYRCATAEALAAEGQTYDVVLAMEIVEHVSNISTFLRATASLVKPGGVLVMSTINRTFKSYAMAIVAAEYILKWLPRGTHTWEKFVKPSELTNGLRRENLTVKNMTGMAYNPLSNSWTLNDQDMNVNYMLAACKAA